MAATSENQGQTVETIAERRAAFIGGEGTLTYREVVEWAREMGFPHKSGDMPIEMIPTDLMMVSVVPQAWPKKWVPGER